MRRFLPLVLALLVSACGGGADIISPAGAQSEPDPKVLQMHFILRPDANGNWFIQNDDGHKPIGVVPQIVQTPTHLRVNFVHVYKYAGTVQVSTDDDFGQVVSAHANLGKSATEIRIKANGAVIDPASIWNYATGPNGNLWVNVTMVD
jgi:hypothetical protein